MEQEYWKHVGTLKVTGWTKVFTYEREVPSGIVIMTVTINDDGSSQPVVSMQLVPVSRVMTAPYR